MKTVIRLFSDHPTSVGETYAEHASYAAGFGFR
ncbi:MAG: capsule biosynthesis protein, partial [Alphaproteobacteria bacterium]|nr:capsule biosynthesis protein [Alphaproteobacteria bacterium]